MSLPGSWSALLWTFRSCFTAPSFATFVALVSGMVAAPARRTVTGMLIGAGVSQVWHHSRAYWFLSRARWSVDRVGLVLLRLIVDRLLPAGVAVTIAVDDTLFRRSGRRVHAAGWHHDGAAKGPQDSRVAWGNCWVIAGVVVLRATDLEDGRVIDGAAGLGVRKPRPSLSGGAFVVRVSRWWSG